MLVIVTTPATCFVGRSKGVATTAAFEGVLVQVEGVVDLLRSADRLT
jgi:hypothetical protein